METFDRRHFASPIDHDTTNEQIEASEQHLNDSLTPPRYQDERAADCEGNDAAPIAEFSGAPLIPPHWLSPRQRRDSFASTISVRPGIITLEDNTINVEDQGQANAVWAKGVYIEDYQIVSGSVPSVGGFVVWYCRIDTLDGSSMIIRRRYSEFADLRRKLLITFPSSAGMMPPFPPKSYIYRFRPDFLEKRRISLGYWLACVLLNPAFSAAPITKEFIFA